MPLSRTATGTANAKPAKPRIPPSATAAAGNATNAHPGTSHEGPDAGHKPGNERQSREVKATVGRIVHYTSKIGDGIVSPAIVLRTRETTNLDVIERWGPSPDGTLSGKGRPAALVAELPDDETVDLLVHGLGGDYREYAIPYSESSEPGTWSWPPRA